MIGIKLKAIRVQELAAPVVASTLAAPTPGIAAIALAGGFLAPGQGKSFPLFLTFNQPLELLTLFIYPL